MQVYVENNNSSNSITKTQKDVLVNYTILAEDDNSTIWFNSATPIVITISDNLPENGEISFINKGLGIVSFVSGGTQLKSPDGSDLERNKVASIIKKGVTDEYLLKGELI